VPGWRWLGVLTGISAASTGGVLLTVTSHTRASRDCGSRGVTTASLSPLTLFRRGRIIHGVTYFEDAGQQSPVRDVATIVQYDSGTGFMARSQHRYGRVNNRPG